MLYLFYGADEFACSEALAEMQAQMPAEVADFNITRLEGRKLKLDELARACEAVPFLADRRLVMVQEALKHMKAGKEREEMRSYLKGLPPTCDLVFVERGDIDKRHIVAAHVKQAGEVREFRPLQGAELLRWLCDRARLLHATLNQQAAQHLVEYVGSDSRTLVTELGKLASYVGQGGRISSEVIDLLVQDRHEHNLFAFIDDLSLRRSDAALSGLRALLAEGQASTYILFMLTRQVRILLGVQELAAQRMRADDIARQLGQKPFVVRKALEQVRSFAAAELQSLHDSLLQADQSIKTGRIQAEVALELLVLEFCQTASRRR